MTEEAQAVAENNDTLTSLVDAAEPTLSEGEYFLSDGIKGTGEMPEWYKADKYKSVAEQARAYTELEKKFGGFTGAPKDGYEMLDDVYEGDELWSELVDFGQRQNMSQAALNEAWGLLTAQEEALEQVNLEMELEALGERGPERIKTVEQFLKNNLDADTYEEVRYAVNSATSIQLVEALINATSPAPLPIDGNVTSGGLTWEDIEAEMFRKNEHGQLLRSVDSNHEKKIQRMMQEYGGDRPYVQTIG